MITPTHYLILSVILFCIGIYGVLTRRNSIGILMSIELMLNAVNINFVAFSQLVKPAFLTGQIFTIFIIALAAAEASVGFVLIFSIYRTFGTVYIDKANLMKW